MDYRKEIKDSLERLTSVLEGAELSALSEINLIRGILMLSDARGATMSTEAGSMGGGDSIAPDPQREGLTQVIREIAVPVKNAFTPKEDDWIAYPDPFATLREKPFRVLVGCPGCKCAIEIGADELFGKRIVFCIECGCNFYVLHLAGTTYYRLAEVTDK